MTTRTASCTCGQLRIDVHGEPLGSGVCHCFVCQRRTGSVFATLACFAAPFEVTGSATQYVRETPNGSRVVFHFCPVCGSTVFHTQGGRDQVDVAVGAFADPSFPPPFDSTFTSRKHTWVELPAATVKFDENPS